MENHVKFPYLIMAIMSFTFSIRLNPYQPGFFGPSIARGGGMCPQEFLSYFVLVFHHKSTKQGLKWKLTSLSTCRVFEHHPKLDSFVMRQHQSTVAGTPMVKSNCYIWILDLFVQFRTYLGTNSVPWYIIYRKTSKKWWKSPWKRSFSVQK